MKILKIKRYFYALLVALSATLIGACGGGSSSSGGAPTAPPPPPFPLFTAGEYSGTLTLALEGEGVVFNNDSQPFGLEVIGNVAGTQQVRIAFLQFSGTSAILREGQFSIPSGAFPLRITTRGGTLLSTCTGELLFEGTFANDTVTGTVTTSRNFVCDRSEFGPISGSGTFEATPGSAKRLGGDGSVLTVIAN